METLKLRLKLTRSQLSRLYFRVEIKKEMQLKRNTVETKIKLKTVDQSRLFYKNLSHSFVCHSQSQHYPMMLIPGFGLSFLELLSFCLWAWFLTLKVLFLSMQDESSTLSLALANVRMHTFICNVPVLHFYIWK